MCGRYELHTHPAALALAFGLAHPPVVTARYNIAPTQNVPIIRCNSAGERELVQVRWGLVPRWARDPSIGARMINARAETVAERPAFRNAYQRHRCLLPADGFYEWRQGASGKQPMHVARTDGRPFGMAGLYERWLSPDGEVLDTCAILTTHANARLRALHDRMPVIVPPEQYDRWLDAAHREADELFDPAFGDALRAHPVSTRVNAVRNDDASLIEAIVLDPQPSTPAAVEEPVEPELPLQPRLL